MSMICAAKNAYGKAPDGKYFQIIDVGKKGGERSPWYVRAVEVGGGEDTWIWRPFLIRWTPASKDAAERWALERERKRG
jgi:hypothetical protein